MAKQFKRTSFNPRVGVQPQRNRKAPGRRYFVPQGPFNSARFNAAAARLSHN